MTTPGNPTPGADIGTWGAKLNALLDYLKTQASQALALAQAAETPTGAQQKADAARTAALAASEAKVVRTGRATNDLVGLAADGTLTLRTPAAGTTLNPATTSAAGIVQLAGDGEAAAGRAVQGNDSRVANVVHSTTVTSVVTITQAAYDALSTRPTTTLYVISG